VPKRSFATAIRRPVCCSATPAYREATFRPARCKAGRCAWRNADKSSKLDYVRDGDTLVVLKLDRPSRSLQDVVHIMQRIAEAGAGFRSLTESIDTTTPSGLIMIQMIGSFSELERAMICERTADVHAAARVVGCIGGRRRNLDIAKRREIAENVISGRMSGIDLARLYNISQPTASCIVTAFRIMTLSRPAEERT
jgi:hypothetical protein